MLRKILEKVFINKIFNQWKTSSTIKIDVYEIPDNKNIVKLFSKYEPLFFNHSISDPSQILTLQFPTPGASLPVSPSMSNFILANLSPSSTQYLSCSSSVSLFFLTSFDQTPPQVLDIPKHVPNQSNVLSSYVQIIISYESNMLPIKKPESLRTTSLSKLDNTVNKNSLFNTKYTGSFTKW